jgi:hypothetical protein
VFTAPISKAPIRPTSASGAASGADFNPLNTESIHAAKVGTILDLVQTETF